MRREDLAKLLGENIATERTKRFKQSGAIAEQIGISRAAMSMIEHGNRLVPLDVLLRLAEAIGCPLTALLKGAFNDDEQYQQGYVDGWSACASEVDAHLTWTPVHMPPVPKPAEEVPACSP